MKQSKPMKSRSAFRCLMCLTIIPLFAPTSMAQNDVSGPKSINGEENSPLERYFNLKQPTLGGTQYWSDVRIVGGWKIQRKAATEHYRLLNSKDIRQAWGPLNQCEGVFQKKLTDQSIHPETGKIVILLHGLLRSSDSMAKLGDYLREQGGYQIINFSYASSTAPIEVHSADLKSVIDGLSYEVSEIHFVAHSMGNIVVRHYLKQSEQTAEGIDPRFKRMVMLAPPNQGSRTAKQLAMTTKLFEKVAGPSGLELGVGWDRLSPKLTTPSFEFGIIIGAKEIEGDDVQSDESDPGVESNYERPLALLKNSRLQPHDFTVSVDEAKLSGATDFLAGPFFHWDIKYHPEAMEQTLHFLKHGRFGSSAQGPLN